GNKAKYYSKQNALILKSNVIAIPLGSIELATQKKTEEQMKRERRCKGQLWWRYRKWVFTK
ncbi:hypothetical protein Ancab_004344, partial [Ancistrocladus abbreviatus]